MAYSKDIVISKYIYLITAKKAYSSLCIGSELSSHMEKKDRHPLYLFSKLILQKVWDVQLPPAASAKYTIWTIYLVFYLFILFLSIHNWHCWRSHRMNRVARGGFSRIIIAIIILVFIVTRCFFVTFDYLCFIFRAINFKFSTPHSLQ